MLIRYSDNALAILAENNTRQQVLATSDYCGLLEVFGKRHVPLQMGCGMKGLFKDTSLQRLDTEQKQVGTDQPEMHCEKEGEIRVSVSSGVHRR